MQNKIEEILFEWTGVRNDSTTSRGGSLTDDRKLGFLEKFIGEDFLQRGSSPNPGGQAALKLDEVFTDTYNNIAARFLLQTQLGDLIEGAAYNPTADLIEGAAGLDLDILSTIEAEASNYQEPLYALQQVVRLVDYTIGADNLSVTDYAALEGMVNNVLPGISLQDVLETILFEGTPQAIYGTNESETIDGDVFNNQIFAREGNDVVSGGFGIDILHGEGGDDLLIGGYGNDDLFGGDGDDIYLYEHGLDNIEETHTIEGNIDTISFASGVTYDDLTFVRQGDNLNIDIANAGGVTVFDQFSSSNKAVEQLEFEDGSIFDLLSISYVSEGTSENDSLTGIQYGGGQNDIIIGHGGDDSLYGKGGNDTYVYNLGDGNDYISDAAGTDKILFGAGITQEDVRLVRRSSYDLELHMSDGAVIRLSDQFCSDATTRVETAEFADGSTLSLTDNFTWEGTSGNDSLSGFDAAETIVGHEGDDSLYGKGGNDTYFYNLGDGNDYISDAAGTDKILFGAGITQEDVRVVRRSSYDLELYMSDGAVIRLVDQFRPDATTIVETAEFADGSTLSLTDNFTWEGTSGNDSLTGFDEAETFIGHEGDDSLYGKGGNDAAVYEGAYANYTISGDVSNMTVTDKVGNEGSDTLYDIEKLVFADGVYENGVFTPDSATTYPDGAIVGTEAGETLTGSGGTNYIYGLAGDDILYGKRGDDFLYGGAGDDTLSGQTGIDTAVYAGVYGNYTVVDNGGGSTVTDNVGNEGTDAAGVERLQFADGVYENGAFTPDGGGPTNSAPVANDDAFTGDEDTPVTGNVLSENGNGADSDPDGDPLSVVAVTGLATDQAGTVDIAANGDFTYTPAAGFFGADSFTYTLEDGQGGSDTATVSLTINEAAPYRGPAGKSVEFSHFTLNYMKY